MQTFDRCVVHGGGVHVLYFPATAWRREFRSPLQGSLTSFRGFGKLSESLRAIKNLSIDEGMIAFKGRLSIWHYMPAKPIKYDIIVWMADDSKNGYVNYFSVYFGKEANVPRVNGLGYDVVMKMASPFLKKHRHIFFDTFFTSTMEDLLLLKTPMLAAQFDPIAKTCRHVQRTN